MADRAVELIGYAACSLEFSPWRAEDHVHLDCLFIAEAHRGEGWRSALLAAVRNAAPTIQVSVAPW